MVKRLRLMEGQSDRDSIVQMLKKAFPAFLVLRGVVFVVSMAVSIVGGIGWIMNTTLNGYEVAFDSMSARMASIDAHLSEVRQTSRDVDKRTSEMSVGLTEIKRMVGDNGQSINYYRDELNDVKKSLHGNREKTAHLLGMIESIQADITKPAAGLN